MAFFSSPPSLDPSEIEEIFNSVMTRQDYDSLYGDSWSAGIMKREITYTDEHVQGSFSFGLVGTIESSLASKERPVSDETTARQDLNQDDSYTTSHGVLSNLVTEEQNSTAGNIEEFISKDHNQITCSSEDDGAQTIPNKGDTSAMNDGRLGGSEQNPEAKVATGVAIDPDHKPAPNDDLPAPQGFLKRSSSEAQEKVNNGTGAANNNETAQTPSKAIFGLTDNPILVDGGQELLIRASFQSTPSTVGRPIRKKRKRDLDGMQPWGSAEFQKLETKNLDSAWLDVQAHWRAIESCISELKSRNRHFERLAIDFDAYWCDFCIEVEQSESIDLSNVEGLIDHWKTVEQGLNRVQDDNKSKVLEFGYTLDSLVDRAALYDCIEKYPSSIDRKHEDEDKDFQNKNSQRPTKRRNRPR